MNRKIFFYLILLAILLFLSGIYMDNAEIKTTALHAGLFFVAIYFIYKKDLNTTLRELGIPGNTGRNALHAILGLLFMFAALFALGFLSNMIGMNDQQAIAKKVGTFSDYLIIFAVVLAPISEEMFFRGLLVSRYGILLPAIAFGAMHFSYGSYAEIAGALIIGLILGWVYKSSKSIVPAIAIHMTYNLIAVWVLRSML